MKKLIALASMGSLCLSVLVGCGSGDTPSEKTKQESSRLEAIQAKSGNDWNKLSQEDKDYLTKELGQGSEAKAKMLLGPPIHSKPEHPKR